MPIRKLLIANRGEIACRVIDCCRAHGIATVAVFSEADRSARHVLSADEACCLGPAVARESYLDPTRVLDAARKTGADAIHPGYGFLSENADFAEACEAAGLVFVGPPPAAIRALGGKTAARRLVAAAGVPVVPGIQEKLASPKDGLAAAAAIGYPVLIKAAAGGGGKGMRVVERPEDFEAAFERAASEARTSFGDPSVYVEKYLAGARHIELQVMADAHGHAVHLGERECSVQRRHQKLLEESPSVFVTPELRERMGAAALAAVRAANYRNLGTVEFLVDRDGAFYFLEVNTRLQVEHPVTELVTGLDLVWEQLRIASGEPLSVTQEQVRPRGHAIECRITAEDPFNGFVPSPGVIRVLRHPRGPFVRVDTGVFTCSEVSLHYDSLIAKLLTWGPDRATAIARARDALREFVIEGIRTTVPFHELLLASPAFVAGDLSTDFIDRHLSLHDPGKPQRHREIAAIAAAFLRHRRVSGSAPAAPAGRSAWKLSGRPGGGAPWR